MKKYPLILLLFITVPRLWSAFGSPAWKYKIPIIIGTCPVDVTDLNVNITLLWHYRMSPDFSDIRFYNSTGDSLLSAWYDDNNSSYGDYSQWWIKIPYKHATGDTVYVVYGNPGAISYSDGGATFPVYDPFEVKISGCPLATRELGTAENGYGIYAQLHVESSFENPDMWDVRFGWGNGATSTADFYWSQPGGGEEVKGCRTRVSDLGVTQTVDELSSIPSMGNTNSYYTYVVDKVDSSAIGFYFNYSLVSYWLSINPSTQYLSSNDEDFNHAEIVAYFRMIHEGIGYQSVEGECDFDPQYTGSLGRPPDIVVRNVHIHKILRGYGQVSATVGTPEFTGIPEPARNCRRLKVCE